MAKRKKRSSPKAKGPEMRRLAWTLAVVALLVITAYRFLETTHGSVFLVDLGLSGRYEKLQGETGARIRKVMSSFAIDTGSMAIHREDASRPGKTVEVYRAEVPAGTSLLQLNAAVDEAVSGMGARVRRCEEKDSGDAIEMEIGTRTMVTQRVIFRLGRRGRRTYRREETGPAISIVVDDFGFSDDRLVREFLSLDIPITVSVIPGLKHSSSICRKARESGKEVLCHLPMEPEKGADDVGDIPLVRVDMTGGEIERIVERALETTPGVIGCNNHMGSRATADRRVMDAVLRVCGKKDLIFFDSLTTPKSVVREAAAEAGVGTARNDLFLDNRREETRENMRKLISLAIKRGRVTAIMHVRSDSLRDLRWMIGEAAGRGVRFVKLSEIVKGPVMTAGRGGNS